MSNNPSASSSSPGALIGGPPPQSAAQSKSFQKTLKGIVAGTYQSILFRFLKFFT